MKRGGEETQGATISTACDLLPLRRPRATEAISPSPCKTASDHPREALSLPAGRTDARVVGQFESSQIK